MKYHITRFSFLLLFLAFLGVNEIDAQTKKTTTKKKTSSKKLGHLNKALLLQQMPAIRQAQTKLEERRKQMLKQLENKSVAIKTRYQKAMEDIQAKKLSEAQAKQEEQAIMTMQRDLAKQEQDLEKQLLQKQEQLFKPILKRIDTAIKAVAKQYGYFYIFDSSSGVLLFMPESRDVTNLVKKKLGMSVK